MTFKERILADLDTVFLNLDEFAEEHRIEGKTIPCVMNNDEMNALKTVSYTHLTLPTKA